jgi:DNA helicase II / ATP-dependent DNA helicase PcrA
VSRLSESISELRDNPQQWEAFQVEGHCAVLAPPGSGKTKLLTTRLTYDLLNRIPEPHGAACITLTNPAADELRRRLACLGAQDRSTVFVGTVHSFALRRIIAPFAKLTGHGDFADALIASDKQKNDAYDAAISEVFSRGADTRNVRSTVEFLRKRMADDTAWARSGDGIIEVNRRYVTKLRAQGLIDFDDVVEMAVNLVQGHAVVRRALTARYPRLYVDEYQDLAPGLDKLVQSLCFDYISNVELFAVGDPEQALYAWTGSRPELLIQLAGRSDVTDVLLERNYRCGQEIIRIANLLHRGRKPVTGNRTGGQVTAHHRPRGFVDQCEGAVQAAEAAIARGVPLHEIVAICPLEQPVHPGCRGDALGRLTRFRSRFGVPFVSVDNTRRRMRRMGRTWTGSQRIPARAVARSMAAVAWLYVDS